MVCIFILKFNMNCCSTYMVIGKWLSLVDININVTDLQKSFHFFLSTDLVLYIHHLTGDEGSS